MKVPAQALVLTIFFLSGGTALIYEITWVRLFSSLFGNSTQAVALGIAVFIGGGFRWHLLWQAN